CRLLRQPLPGAPKGDAALPAEGLLGRRLTHEEEVRFAAFRPDGATVVTATNRVAGLWLLDTGKRAAAPADLDGKVERRYARDGVGVLLADNRQKLLQLRDAATEQPLGPTFGPAGRGVKGDLSPD